MAPANVAPERAQIVGRIPGRQDDGIGRDDASRGADLDRLAARPHAKRRRPLEDERAARRRRAREAEARAIRIDLAVAVRLDAADAVDRRLAPERRGAQPGGFHARLLPGLELTAQPPLVFSPPRERDRVGDVQLRSDAEPAERGGEVERGPARPLPQCPRGAPAVGGRRPGGSRRPVPGATGQDRPRCRRPARCGPPRRARQARPPWRTCTRTRSRSAPRRRSRRTSSEVRAAAARTADANRESDQASRKPDVSSRRRFEARQDLHEPGNLDDVRKGPSHGMGVARESVRECTRRVPRRASA